MKKVLSIIFSVIAIANIANANVIEISIDKSSIHIEEGSKTLVLNLKDKDSKKVGIKIIDESGDVVYTDKVNSKKLNSKTYDLRKFEDGKYTIVIDDLLKIERINFTVNPINISMQKATMTYKPVIWKNDSSIDINMLTLGSEVNLEIIDADGITMVKKTFEGQNTINERISLDSGVQGDVLVIIKSETNRFIKTLKF